MKKLSIISLAIIVSLFLSLLISCSSEKTTTAPATTQAPVTTTSKPAVQPVELLFAATDPEEGLIGDIYHWWADELEKRTNGAVKIKFYWNNTLVKMPEMLEAVKKGVADMGNFVPPYFGATFALHANIDGMYVFDQHPLARIMANEAYDKAVPEAEAEWTDNGFVKLFCWAPSNYHVSCLKELKTLADFKGLKFRATGPMNPVILKAAGAVPVNFTHAELYDALVKGEVDGSVTDYDLMFRFGEAEVTPYVIRLFIGANSDLTTLIKKDVYDKLSPDVKKVLTDLRAEYPAKYNEYFKKRFMEVSIPGLQKAGIKIIDLPPADLQSLMNDPSVKALSEGWVDWILDKKPSLTKERAAEIQKTYLKLLDDYVKQYPDRLEP
jgi:TRAP-type C4-dicarboxylate transport system substrate-binding protein